MSDFTAGYTFSSGEKNITHTKLNAIISGLVCNPSFISGRAEESSAATDDYFFFLDASANAFKKISKANLFPTSSSATTISKDITQAAHGFVVGDVIYRTSGSWAKAKADAASTAEAVGIVSAVPTVNTFTVVVRGEITGLSGLTDGTLYFVSAGTAGALTSTEPTTNGHFVRPILEATGTTSGYVNPQVRTKITASGGLETTSGAAISGNVGEIRTAIAQRSVSGTSDTLLDADRGGIVTYSNASAVAVTVPQAGAASAFLNKWHCIVRVTGTGRVTFTPTTSTINGATTLVLGKNQAAIIFSDGTNYIAVVIGTAAEEPIGFVASEQSVNGTTLADITGMSFAVKNGETWLMEGVIIQKSDNANGQLFAINGPTGTLNVGFRGNAGTIGNGQSDVLNTVNTAGATYNSRNSGAYDTCVLFAGTFTATADGTVQFRQKCGGANNQYVGVGSYVRARRIA